MSHMSAANTPAQGPVHHHHVPPLDLDESLRRGTTVPPIDEQDQEWNPDYNNDYQPHFTGASDLKDYGPHHPLFHDLNPPDSYTEDGTYWADLPLGQRVGWVNRQMNAEAKRELGVIGRMFKEDPLSPISSYFRRYVIGGFGLFTEGYTIFSIGNLSSLYSSVWKTCWGTYKVCNKNWVSTVTYLQPIGIMFGQVIVGIEGDWIGRKFGLVQDALVMFLGLIMLTASWGTSLNGWVICYAWSQFFYCLGVGGEYPMTSTTALESKTVGVSSHVDDRLHRGRNVVLAFLMQGWGQLFNQGVLIILLLIFHGGSKPPYSEKTAQWTFRISFAIMAVMTLYLAYYRYYKKVYSSNALKRSKANARVNQSGYDVQALKLSCSHFGGRLIGSTTCWFFNDFLFYGNKLFQSSFIKVINPKAASNVVTNWNWNLVNIGVSLVGYYLAAILIDHKLYGRKKMQIIGFLMDGIFFLIPAIWFTELQTPERIRGFQTIYYLSSFFQQFGPNCTTFLVAAEIFPISVRATSHGLSAAAGKLGALAPAIIYNYVGTRTRFWIVCWFGFAGWIMTWLFIPDTTGLDLKEQDRYWSYVREGRANEYHGVAIHPQHLSLWEKLVLKRHKNYDPIKDREAKAVELRKLYEEVALSRHNKEANSPDVDLAAEEHDAVSSSAATYFERTPRMAAVNGVPPTKPAQ